MNEKKKCFFFCLPWFIFVPLFPNLVPFIIISISLSALTRSSPSFKLIIHRLNFRNCFFFIHSRPIFKEQRINGRAKKIQQHTIITIINNNSKSLIISKAIRFLLIKNILSSLFFSCLQKKINNNNNNNNSVRLSDKCIFLFSFCFSLESNLKKKKNFDCVLCVRMTCFCSFFHEFFFFISKLFSFFRKQNFSIHITINQLLLRFYHYY